MSYTACHLCDRGGRGNAADKCACGWRVTKESDLGCFLGTPLVGEPVEPKKLSRSKQRYRDFLHADYGHSFREWLGIKRKATP